MNKSKKVGRKTIITGATVAKLVEAFKLGTTDELACRHAQIDRSTYYRNLEKNPDFATKMRSAKNYCLIKASQVVMNSITKDKNVSTAMWWLEKKYPGEFGRPTPTKIGQNINVINPSWFTPPSKRVPSKVIEADDSTD